MQLFKVGSTYALHFEVTDVEKVQKFFYETGLFPWNEEKSKPHGMISKELSWSDTNYREELRKIHEFMNAPERVRP